MRVSVDRFDPGYRNFLAARDAGRTAIILVDGKRLRRIVTADEAEGWALGLALNEKGRPFKDPDDPERIATVEYRGRVSIRLVRGYLPD